MPTARFTAPICEWLGRSDRTGDRSSGRSTSDTTVRVPPAPTGLMRTRQVRPSPWRCGSAVASGTASWAGAWCFGAHRLVNGAPIIHVMSSYGDGYLKRLLRPVGGTYVKVWEWMRNRPERTTTQPLPHPVSPSLRDSSWDSITWCRGWRPGSGASRSGMNVSAPLRGLRGVRGRGVRPVRQPVGPSPLPRHSGV